MSYGDQQQCDRDRQARMQYSRNWDTLLDLLNSLVYTNGRIAVYLCGRIADRAEVVKDVARGIVRLFLTAIPGKPEGGKWTKTPRRWIA